MAKKIQQLEDLLPDPHNANAGTERGMYMIETSLEKLGAGRSIVVDRDGRVIAGNKTLQAALEKGFGVQVVRTDGKRLVVVQREDLVLDADDGKARQLAYADNRASEVGLAWDAEQVLADLRADVDLESWFKQDELDALLIGLDSDIFEADEKYTAKVESPIYEPTGEKPAVSELYDSTKTDALVNDINAADLPDDIRTFLTAAAQRHTVFNFQKIAEFYAHADAPTQRLMENSALVIVDFNRAIELGFVKLTERFKELVGQDYGAE